MPSLINNADEEIENKRIILSELFSDFELKSDKIKPKYTLSGEFLAKWMPRVNSTFGLSNFSQDYKKTGLLQPVSSTLLPGSDSNRRPIG